MPYCRPTISTYASMLQKRRADHQANAQAGRMLVAAMSFARQPSQEALIGLIQGSLGGDAANDYRAYLDHRTATADWVNVLAYNEQIELKCEMPFWLSIQAKEGGQSKAPAIEIEAYNGGPMNIAGYRFPVVVDVAGVEGYGRSIPILRDHNATRVVGHGVAHAHGNRSMRLRGVFSVDNADSREIIDSSKHGFPWQASIGLQPIRIQQVFEDDSTHVNGADMPGPLYVIREGKLKEVSIVALGADDSTSARVAAAEAKKVAPKMAPVLSTRADELPRHKRELKRKAASC
jgi:hypothetical protein